MHYACPSSTLSLDLCEASLFVVVVLPLSLLARDIPPSLSHGESVGSNLGSCSPLEIFL